MELHLNSIISKKPGNAKFPLIHKFYYTVGGKWPSSKRRTHQPMSLPSGDSYQLLTQSLALASWFTEEHCPNLYVVGWSPEHSKFIQIPLHVRKKKKKKRAGWRFHLIKHQSRNSVQSCSNTRREDKPKDTVMSVLSVKSKTWYGMQWLNNETNKQTKKQINDDENRGQEDVLWSGIHTYTKAWRKRTQRIRPRYRNTKWSERRISL